MVYLLPMKLSLHQMDVIDSLKMLKLIGREPKDSIGIEPKNIDCGLELSPRVKSDWPNSEKRMEEIKKADS